MSDGGNIAAGVGMQAGNNLFNVAYDYITYKRNRKDREADYQQQKADNREMWNAQNQYNSPEQQMNRLRQAGLNPNLVYGKGADNTAQAINTSKKDPSTMVNSKIEGGSNLLMQAAQIKNIKANTDNLYSQNAVLAQEALLKTANIANVGSLTSNNKFDLQQRQALNESVIQQAKLNLQKTQSDMDVNQGNLAVNQGNLAVNQANSAINRSNSAQQIAESKVRAAKTDEERKNAIATRNILQNENKVREFEAKLAQMNLSKNDPLAARVMVKLAEQAVDKTYKTLDNTFKFSKKTKNYLNQNSPYWDNYKKYNK